VKQRNEIPGQPPKALTAAQAEAYAEYTKQATGLLTNQRIMWSADKEDVDSFRAQYPLAEPDSTLLTFINLFYEKGATIRRTEVWLGFRRAEAEREALPLRNFLEQEKELELEIAKALEEMLDLPGSLGAYFAERRLETMQARMTKIVRPCADRARHQLAEAVRMGNTEVLHRYASQIEALKRPLHPGEEWSEDTWRRCAVLHRLAECLLREHRLPTKGELREFLDHWIEARDPEGTKVSVISGPQFSRMLKELGLAGLPAQRQGKKGQRS
jgi:hypothetical protein